MKLTKEEKEKAYRHIRDTDKLFDGYYYEGVLKHDRATAYNNLRGLTLELLEKLEQ